MDIEEIRAYCLGLKNVTEDMPFGDDVLIFRVENKIFLALSLNSQNPKITLKANADDTIEMRERYTGVTPAYHWNKKYWNDISLQGDMPAHEIFRRINGSYNEVILKLPKKTQALYSLL